MTEELNINKIVAEFMQANLEKLLDATVSKVRHATEIARGKLHNTYRDYLVRLLAHYSLAKSFFIRDKATSLYSFFVPLDLRLGETRLRRPGAAQLAVHTNCGIVTGSAGSGKSMLMRHFLISSIQGKHKVPIFIELRELNQTEMTIVESLLKALDNHGVHFDEDDLNRALANKTFCILLDGYDELDHSHRTRVGREIRTLATKYSGNWFFISSREDDEFDGWQNFEKFSICPLSLPSAIDLVAKVPFDDKLKASFTADLQSKLFRHHESLLSNPLLLSIMLLTYSDTANIPEKLSIFYEQAYQSLFQRHDALKSGFQRKRFTSLDLVAFGRVFSAFSLQSYDRRKFSFTKATALDYIDKSKRITGLEYDANGFLRDAIQAVCLLIEEGLNITFAHRSFQEYFVARFIRFCTDTQKKKFIHRYAAFVQTDSVISLLHEMDPDSVERFFVLPAIDKILKVLGKSMPITIGNYLKYLRLLYTRFDLFYPPQPRVSRHPSSEPRASSDGELVLSVRVNDGILLAAVVLIATRYMPKLHGGHPLITKEIRTVLRDEIRPAMGIPTVQLTTSSTAVRMLADQDGIIGIQFLRDLIDVRTMISERHRQQEDSLDTILE